MAGKILIWLLLYFTDYSGTSVGASLGAKHCDPSNRQRVALLSYNDSSPSYQGTEIMREAASFQYSSEMDLFWPDQREDRFEPDLVLMKILEETEADSLGVELVPAAFYVPSEQNQQPISVLSEEAREFFDFDSAYGGFQILNLMNILSLKLFYIYSSVFLRCRMCWNYILII